MKTIRYTAAVLVMIMATAHGAWNEFHGPNGTGVAEGAEPPLTWSESKNVKWKAEIPGRGYSSPVTDGRRIWLTTAIEVNTLKKKVETDMCWVADKITLKLICVNVADGKKVYSVTLFEREKPDPVHEFNSFSTPTPFLDGKRIYCDFGTYGTACVEAETGKVSWEAVLKVDHQAGPGSSPIVYKDVLVLVRDGRDRQYIAGLDKLTGKELWKTDRPALHKEVPSINWRKSFSTPTLYTVQGKDRMVVPCAQWIAAYDPQDGTEAWRLPHGIGFSIAPRPSVGNGLIYYGTGSLRPQLWAVRMGGSGKLEDSQVAWKNTRHSPRMTTPLLLGSEIYWVSDTGTACCANAETGEMVWQEKLEGKFVSSPVSAAGRVYFVNKSAMTFVIKPGREYKLLSANALTGENTIAVPAIEGKSIYIRTGTHLYRIEE